MTATEKLRQLLDERGVPWRCYGHDNHTWWGAWHAENRSSVNDLFVKVEGVVTPARAVEATLGRHTTTRCGKFRTKYGRSVPVCECCGYGIGDMRWNYCPSCGAEVVDA